MAVVIFQAGDHICLPRGQTGVIKHHAIVVTSQDTKGVMEIMEYGVFDSSGKKKFIAGIGIPGLHGEVRKNTVDTTKESDWQLVSYKKNDKSVKASSDVVKAANFLLEKGTKILPAYHVAFANGECVASWCKTGNFASAQADRIYNTVEKVEKVSKAVPMVTSVTKKKSSTTTTSTAKGKASTAAAGVAIATAVAAAGTMIHNHMEKVGKEWEDTNTMLNAEYAKYSK